MVKAPKHPNLLLQTNYMDAHSDAHMQKDGPIAWNPVASSHAFHSDLQGGVSQGPQRKEDLKGYPGP